MFLWNWTRCFCLVILNLDVHVETPAIVFFNIMFITWKKTPVMLVCITNSNLACLIFLNFLSVCELINPCRSVERALKWKVASYASLSFREDMKLWPLGQSHYCGTQSNCLCQYVATYWSSRKPMLLSWKSIEHMIGRFQMSASYASMSFTEYMKLRPLSHVLTVPVFF